MNQLLVDYAALIVHHTFSLETGPGSKTVERHELLFTDTSRLATYESRNGLKFKYSYQWMSANNDTIYRCDNTPHFPVFNTFPFHRHVGPNEIAEPYPAISLAEVIHFIAAALLLQ